MQLRTRHSRKRLRVGVPASLAGLSPQSGHGRTWHNVLRGLADHVDIVVKKRISTRRRVDVWVANGHDGVLEVAQPWIAHIHEAGWFSDELKSVLDPVFLDYTDNSTRAAVTKATRVIAQSESSRRQIIDAYGVAPEQVDTCYPGVDAAIFTPEASEQASTLLAAAGGDPAVPYVLYVGTFHPRKNLPALRQAISDLAACRHALQLVIVGAPAPDRADSAELERSALEPISGALGVVRANAPNDREMAALMAGAFALCLPSLMEGFGLPLLEAMACGCPVVAANRGAMPEVVGDAGLLIEPEASAVRDALLLLLENENERRRFSQEGVARARQFSWETTVAQWLRSLERAVEHG